MNSTGHRLKSGWLELFRKSAIWRTHGSTWGHLSVGIEYIWIESVAVTRKTETEKERVKRTATMQFSINKLYFVSEQALVVIVGVSRNGGRLRFVCVLESQILRSWSSIISRVHRYTRTSLIESDWWGVLCDINIFWIASQTSSTRSGKIHLIRFFSLLCGYHFMSPSLLLHSWWCHRLLIKIAMAYSS